MLEGVSRFAEFARERDCTRSAVQGLRRPSQPGWRSRSISKCSGQSSAFGLC